MTDKEYRAVDAISKSSLWEIRKSPLHFKWAKEHPEPPTPALLFGAACHKFVLEPETLGDEYAVCPQCDKRTKEGKAIYAEFCESAAGKDIITADDMTQIVEMQAALTHNEFCKKLLAGEHEVPLFWTDDITSEPCKARADAVIDAPIAAIIDYKTTDDASTEAFMRSAIKYGYDVQAAHYLRGAKAVYGKDFTWLFIAQEKKPPYAVNVLQASDAFLERGTGVLLDLMDTYHQCKQSGVWWGYEGVENVVNELGIPAWAVI